MDDSRKVVYRLEAENDVSVWLKTVRPALIARCQEGKTDAYVVTHSSASVEYGSTDEHTVRLRFDEDKATTERWTESTDNDALFAPQPVRFLRSLATSEALRFGYTPFNASPVVVEFTTRGFGEPFQNIASTCKWSAEASDSSKPIQPIVYMWKGEDEYHLCRSYRTVR
jgi:hypothetical protein